MSKPTHESAKAVQPDPAPAMSPDTESRPNAESSARPAADLETLTPEDQAVCESVLLAQQRALAEFDDLLFMSCRSAQAFDYMREAGGRLMYLVHQTGKLRGASRAADAFFTSAEPPQSQATASEPVA